MPSDGVRLPRLWRFLRRLETANGGQAATWIAPQAWRARCPVCRQEVLIVRDRSPETPSRGTPITVLCAAGCSRVAIARACAWELSA
jgi:hypothetical protein